MDSAETDDYAEIIDEEDTYTMPSSKLTHKCFQHLLLTAVFEAGNSHFYTNSDIYGCYYQVKRHNDQIHII